MMQRQTDRADPVSQLRFYIAEGGFRPGARLPSERQLTEDLGLTRNALRKALDALEHEGAIWRHVGKGTFIADKKPEVPGGAIIRLGRQLTPFRMMRARMAIEPAIAREAAVNASGDTMDQMRRIMERTRAAPNWGEYERQDDLFHRAVADASDNLLLVSLFDQLNQVRRAVAWGSVTRQSVRPPVSHTSFSEHEAIATAIEGRDQQAAYDAMRNHLRSVSERLFGED